MASGCNPIRVASAKCASPRNRGRSNPSHSTSHQVRAAVSSAMRSIFSSGGRPLASGNARRSAIIPGVVPSFLKPCRSSVSPRSSGCEPGPTNQAIGTDFDRERVFCGLDHCRQGGRRCPRSVQTIEDRKRNLGKRPKQIVAVVEFHPRRHACALAEELQHVLFERRLRRRQRFHDRCFSRARGLTLPAAETTANHIRVGSSPSPHSSSERDTAVACCQGIRGFRRLRSVCRRTSR